MHKLTVEEMNRLDVAAFKEAPKLPLVVVLDNVRSLHNVGSVFRTADAFRLSGVCLCGITGRPPMIEIHKTALGAEDSVDWEYFEEPLAAVEALRRRGYLIFAVEQVAGSRPLHQLRLTPDQKYALVLGNEVKGVTQSVVDAADAAVEIPQYGTKHSLNVSVSAGIVLWEFAKQLGFSYE